MMHRDHQFEDRFEDRFDDLSGDQPGGAAHDALDARLAEALACTPSGPDLTRTIMGQLGYMRAADGAVRRRRRLRLVLRGAVCLAVGILVLGAMQAYVLSPRARRPVGPTVPGAVGHDVEMHQQRLHRTWRTIRNLATPGDVSRPDPSGSFVRPVANDVHAPSDEIDDDVDRSAVGPVRWL